MYIQSKYIITAVVALCIFVAGVGGCGTGKTDLSGTDSNTVTEDTDISDAAIETETANTPESNNTSESSSSISSLFPETPVCNSDKVTFGCSLEVPEGFNPDSFYLPKVNGKAYLTVDKDTIYSKYVSGQEVKEEYDYPSEQDDVPDDYTWVLSDDGYVSTGSSGFSMSKPEASTYLYVTRQNLDGASHDNFSFATAEDSIAEVKDTLSDISFPVDQYRFSWFSLSGEEHRELEQAALEEGLLDSDNVQADWTGKDEYEIWAWQVYEGLSVIPAYMTNHMNVAEVIGSYGGTLSAIVTADGILSLNAETPYSLEATSEKVSFVPFSQISEQVAAHYENLLTDSTYTVKQAMLVLRLYQNQAEETAAVPVWYLEVQDYSAGEQDSRLDILLFDASSGEEIYMNN